MIYSDLLKSPHWQRKRLTIFNRDEFTCRRCSDTETQLHAHHLYYRLDLLPWEYPDDALITLCDLCHMKYHFIQWLFRVGVYNLRKEGFTEVDLMDIRTVVVRQIEANRHRESAIRYMDNIKLLCHG